MKKSHKKYAKNTKRGGTKKKPRLIIVEDDPKKVPKKTIKRRPKLKIIEEDLKPSVDDKNMSKETPRWNEKFIDVLDKLSSIMLKQGEPFRARAYQKAQETIMSYPNDISSVEQLKGLPAIGSTITEKLTEYVTTGTLRVLEREKTNPINLFGDIYGIGPKKAQELVSNKIITIEQLREKQNEVLNDTQKIGLKYYDDILKRIPRQEIDVYNKLFSEIFQKIVGKAQAQYEIVGSYRRGAENSGDIDVIITSSNDLVFKGFIDELIREKIILEVLSRGQTKCLVITRLPGGNARRVDFLYTTPEEYPFSVLYFTGSKIFNTVMRARAQHLGFSLNEHGMYKMEGKKKGDKVSHVFISESSIFDFLNMVYKEPHERIDGRAVMATIPEPTIPEPKLVKKTGKKTLKKKLVIEEDDHLPETGTEEKEFKDLIATFKKVGITLLENLPENKLSDMITLSSKYYYNEEPLLTDGEYDILKEYVENKYPQNKTVKEVGAPIEILKNKATLPYEMASMDKIKPDTNALAQWKKKFSGPYVISGKLDGVSGLYTTEGSSAKLYTRGNGKVGQDVAHLIPYLQLPTEGGIVVRGEFILPKKVFKEKYSQGYANARNLVAGIVNRITMDDKVSDLHFVAYEVVKPEMKPSEQMAFLQSNGFETVVNSFKTDITNEKLSQYLVNYRKNYMYETDGIIVSGDEIYPRKSGNPEHAFAFKMVLSDQVAEGKVVDVIWTPSKDGYLKPRVRIEPIQLGGVTIEYATGFNGAFIEQNKIGIGALIEIVRSGDVIPHIRAISTPAENAKMPDVPFKWTTTHVDIILENIGTNETVQEKNILGFFRGIDVVGLSSGTVAKLYSSGNDSVQKIIHMSKTDFLKVPGFQEKTATKLYEGIRAKLGEASLAKLMSVSNLFGRGFSDKKIEIIMETYPTILTSTESPGEKTKMVSAIKGMSAKSATEFIDKIPGFVVFLQECGLEDKLLADSSSAASVDTTNPLYKKSVVMTGFRDKTIMDFLKKMGASLGSGVSKNTFLVLVKNIEEADTGKALEAKKLGIPIMTPEEFNGKFMAT